MTKEFDIDDYSNFVDVHWVELENDFIEQNVPPEDQPLDDDIPDFVASYLEEHGTEFTQYCTEEYLKWRSLRS